MLYISAGPTCNDSGINMAAKALIYLTSSRILIFETRIQTIHLLLISVNRWIVQRYLPTIVTYPIWATPSLFFWTIWNIDTLFFDTIFDARNIFSQTVCLLVTLHLQICKMQKNTWEEVHIVSAGEISTFCASKWLCIWKFWT